MVFILSGCHVRYMDPYSGNEDHDRDFTSEGLVSSVFNLFVVGGKKPGEVVAEPIKTVHLKNQPVASCAPAHLVNWGMLDAVTEDLKLSFREAGVTIVKADDQVIVLIKRLRYKALDRLAVKLASYPETRVEMIGQDAFLVDRIERYFNKKGVSPARTVAATYDPKGAFVSGEHKGVQLAMFICTTVAASLYGPDGFRPTESLLKGSFFE